MYTVNPQFQIYVYGFRNRNELLNNGGTPATDSFTNDIVYGESVKLPMELVEEFSYEDSVESGSFEISLVEGHRKEFSIFSFDVQVEELLSIGHIIVITENKKIKFSGQIHKRSRRDEPSGESSFKVSGSGLEGLIEKQILTIDLMAEYMADKNLKTAIEPDALATYMNGLSTAFNTLSTTVTELKSPGDAIQKLFEGCLENFLNKSLFGGSNILDLINYMGGISTDSYSNGLIHIIPWINQAQFGNQINYWNLIESIATQPLYECFFHYNESASLWIEDGFSNVYIDSDYSNNMDTIGNLIFRKTPWMYLDDYYNNGKTDKDYLVYKLDESHITNLELEDDLDNIFTGVHIQSSAFEQKKSSKIVPVLYNPALLAKYGQRVLTVNLDGIDFGRSDKNKSNPQIDNLKEIQELLYKHFGQGTKIVSGSINIDYHRDICKGKIVRIVRTEKTPASKVLERYMDTFYITGIRTIVNPSRGECSQSLSVKWGEIRTKQKDENAPIEIDTNFMASSSMLYSG